mgnify:CR=1 FL=1
MEFVDFDLAKKLKEKGFNVPFYFYYRTDDKYLHHTMAIKPLVYCDKIEDEVVCAPTISQVLKWLREEKKIYVSVEVEREDWFEYKIVQTIKNTRCTGTRVYDTYIEAILAGIEYVIHNLI